MAAKFDAVIVGAGPAGVAAAYTVAKAGMKTIILERGEKPGAKNVFGGIIFRHHTEHIVPPEAWKTAPIERQVVEHQYWFLSKGSHLVISHKNQKFREQPNAYTVHRSKFDPWFAKFAEEAGAVLINRTTAEDVIRENGRIVGVATDRGDVYADVVIAADGANSLLAERAGLREPMPPEAMVLAAKEVVALPRQKIEERFNLRGDQGLAAMLVGFAPGMHAGFIYTNRDTISIGVGASLKDLKAGGLRPHDVLETFKNHPSVQPLIADSELKEYSAHLIPEGGYDYVPNVHTDGMLLVGDAAMLVNVVGWEGTNLAITSGMLAGETVIQAKNRNDFSERTLSQYRDALGESFVIRDLRKFRRVPSFFASRPHFFSTYPQLINELAYLWHVVDEDTKDRKIAKMKRLVWRSRTRLGLLSDALGLWRIFR